MGITRDDEIQQRLDNEAPMIVAYPIVNGYLIRMRNSNGATGFTYCADHKAIADYIISNSARTKMGIPEQLEFNFDQPGTVTVRPITSGSFMATAADDGATYTIPNIYP